MPGVVEGRVGVGALAGLYADSLARLGSSRHLRLSLAWWAAWGVLASVVFTAALAGAVSAHETARDVPLAVGWWLLVTAVLAGGAAMLVTPDGHPFDGYGVPNGLTAVRAYACLPLLLCALLPLPGRLGLAIWGGVGGAIGLLDLADGFIARRVGPLTVLGKALDPAMDALFFAMAAWGAVALGVMPLWLTVLTLVRYLGPLVGTPVVLLARRRPELVHTVWGRRNTLFMGVVLFACLLTRVADRDAVEVVALAVGLPLLVPTAVLHFVALGRRTWFAPVVRPRRRDR